MECKQQNIEKEDLIISRRNITIVVELIFGRKKETKAKNSEPKKQTKRFGKGEKIFDIIKKYIPNMGKKNGKNIEDAF